MGESRLLKDVVVEAMPKKELRKLLAAPEDCFENAIITAQSLEVASRTEMVKPDQK